MDAVCGCDRVLPAAKDRYCFTLWLSQARGRPPPPPPLPALLRQLLTPGTPAWEVCKGKFLKAVCMGACVKRPLL